MSWTFLARIMAPVVLAAGLVCSGWMARGWYEGDREGKRIARQLEADQEALRLFGAARRTFDAALVWFLNEAARPDPIRRIRDVPAEARGDCPHTDVSARLRNENAAALNAARARDRARLRSHASMP